MAETQTGAPPRVVLVVASVLAVALAAGVAVFGLTHKSDDEPNAGGPLPLVSVPAPHAGEPGCATLVGAVPAELTSAGKKLQRRELAAPAPPSTVAWGDENPIVLRCGLDKPPELTQSSQTRVINGVQWLQVEGEGVATWYVVDREVYSALTVPNVAGTGPLQEVSDTVRDKLPAQPLKF